MGAKIVALMAAMFFKGNLVFGAIDPENYYRETFLIELGQLHFSESETPGLGLGTIDFSKQGRETSVQLFNGA